MTRHPPRRRRMSASSRTSRRRSRSSRFSRLAFPSTSCVLFGRSRFAPPLTLERSSSCGRWPSRSSGQWSASENSAPSPRKARMPHLPAVPNEQPIPDSRFPIPTMRLSRFFGGGKANEPEEPDRADDPAAVDETAPEPDGGDGVPEGDRDIDLDLEWRERAGDVIPGGASTGSKRLAALYGDEATGRPTHFVRASGCHITTAGERTLIDCTMALGSVTLGYGDE